MAPGSLPESHISVQIQAIMMNLKLFKVSGRVYQAESDIGIPNLIIEAFDKDVVKNDKLGQATTNSEGTFEITYSEADFKSKYEVLESNPDLYIVIKTPDLSQILYSSEKNIRRNVKSHEHFDVAIPQATLSANQQGLAKDNKQLLKLLVGIAWLDGELEPGEQEFLQRLANAKGLADDPEVQALLSVDRPVQPEECYGWLQAYLKSSSEDKDFQELYEAINSLIYSDGELDSQEKELLAELAATDDTSNRKLTLQRRFMSLMLDSKFLGNILQMERSSMVSQAAVGAGYYARVPYQVINRFSTTTQTKILAGDMAKLYLTDNFAPVKKEITVNNLTVEGELPKELNGMFLRNGPNPQLKPVGLHHWLDGDGMLHCVEISYGKASYRNRYIRTDGFKVEQTQGKAIWPGLLNLRRFDIPHGLMMKNTANTS